MTSSSNSRWLRPLAVIMLVSMICQAFGRLTFAVLLPSMVADYVGNYSAAGLATSVNLAGYMAGTCASMALASRLDSWRLMQVGLGFVVLSMVLIAANSSVILLDLAQFVGGLGCATGWLSCGAVADAIAPPGRKGLTFGLMFAGVGVGITLIGGIVILVRSLFGPDEWRAAWWIECVIGLIALVLVRVVLKPAGAGRETASPAGPFLRDVLWLLCLVSLSYALFGLAHATYTTFLTAALHEDRQFTVASATKVYSLLGVMNIVGGTLFGRLSDVVGRRPLLIAGYALMISCAATVCAGPRILGLLSPLLYGLVMSGVPTVLTAFVYGSVRPEASRLAYGAMTLAVGGGNLLGPLLGGYLADASGSFAITYDMAAVAAGAAAVAALMSFRHGRPEPLGCQDSACLG